MDILQSQPIIEHFLNSLLTQSSETIDKVKHILEMIVHGVQVFGSISILISNFPELAILAEQLLNLILIGASIHEIAIALINFANSLGLSLEIVIQLLQTISQMLAIF